MLTGYTAPLLEKHHLQSNLIEAMVMAQKKVGPNFVLMEDAERVPLTFRQFFQRSFALSALIKRKFPNEKHIGLMLPTSNAGAVSFVALHLIGKIPVMINFTSGNANVRSACITGHLQTILTSRRFIEIAKLNDLVEAMNAYVHIVYLEDIRSEIGLTDRIYAAAAAMAPLHFSAPLSHSDVGVILFTSGSFGKPRGVVLTHANLLSNPFQVDQHIGLKPHWVFFNPMPIFHSLGLIAGIILPLTIGLRCFNYPSPLHVKQIPTLLKAIKASVFFSTDTFINQYVRNSDADCFSTLEFAVCGAEKVRDETHNLFVRQFGGLPLLEGYGVTETSPVISINKPDDNHPGTVGQLLPGMEARLEPVEGIENGGRLYVRGPNIMKGYIYEEDPGTIEAPAEGWHDTGDIVNIDDQGYIRILGRAKRFAKIAGEMVSLTTVEKLVEDLWPDNRHAVIAVSDDKKGERLILFTDNGTANLSHVAEFAKSEGIPPLAVPKTLFKLSEVPVLGSGKTDYVTLQRLAITG